ncbi:hypothetical protein FKP32DRAFT_1539943, partial [Trametes sanguinea]
IDLRLNQATFNATACLAFLPPLHPLHKMVRCCSHCYPRLHRSPLHELFQAFPELQGVEVIHPSLVDPTWQSPIRTLIEPIKDSTAALLADRLVSNPEFCVFTDGSGFAGDIGAAASAKGREQEHVQHVNLGSEDEHIVFEGELAGMILAFNVI